MTTAKKKRRTGQARASPAPAGADVPEEKSVDQLIRELRRGENEIVRSTAAGWLGHMKSEKAVLPLIEALRDEHPYVRHGAAWALGEMRSARAVEALRQALHDDDTITRVKAAEALGKIQGAPAVTA